MEFLNALYWAWIAKLFQAPNINIMLTADQLREHAELAYEFKDHPIMRKQSDKDKGFANQILGLLKYYYDTQVQAQRETWELDPDGELSDEVKKRLENAAKSTKVNWPPFEERLHVLKEALFDECRRRAQELEGKVLTLQAMVDSNAVDADKLREQLAELEAEKAELAAANANLSKAIAALKGSKPVAAPAETGKPDECLECENQRMLLNARVAELTSQITALNCTVTELTAGKTRAEQERDEAVNQRNVAVESFVKGNPFSRFLLALRLALGGGNKPPAPPPPPHKSDEDDHSKDEHGDKKEGKDGKHEEPHHPAAPKPPPSDRSSLPFLLLLLFGLIVGGLVTALYMHGPPVINYPGDSERVDELEKQLAAEKAKKGTSVPDGFSFKGGKLWWDGTKGDVRLDCTPAKPSFAYFQKEAGEADFYELDQWRISCTELTEVAKQ